MHPLSRGICWLINPTSIWWSPACPFHPVLSWIQAVKYSLDIFVCMGIAFSKFQQCFWNERYASLWEHQYLWLNVWRESGVCNHSERMYLVWEMFSILIVLIQSACLHTTLLSPSDHSVMGFVIDVCLYVHEKAPTSRHRDWSVDVSPASWGCGLYCWVGGLQRSSVWVGFTYCSTSGDPHIEHLEAIVVFLSPHLGIQDCVPESHGEGISRWEPQSASAEPHWQHYLLRVPVHDPRAVWVW